MPPMDYEDEPSVVFSPLSEKDYCNFYNLEMDSFEDDASFYLTFLHKNTSVLELGCGSGRLTRLLAPQCKHVTGIDISPEMLRQARLKRQDNITYLQADMADFRLDQLFDCIIIPYNTLNLLHPRHLTEKCLRLCRSHLRTNGSLLFQIYNPNSNLLQSAGEKLFQFTILKHDNGDTLIKETIKSYSVNDECLILVERYRDRPFISKKPQRDLEHSLKLYVPPKKIWETVLFQCGFTIKQCVGDYSQTLFSEEEDPILLIQAMPYT